MSPLLRTFVEFTIGWELFQTQTCIHLSEENVLIWNNNICQPPLKLDMPTWLRKIQSARNHVRAPGMGIPYMCRPQGWANISISNKG